MAAIPEKVDVVVVGSGATGLAAAVTLSEGGATVAVFEKQRALGGTSNFFFGTFVVESQMQRERFADYSRDDAFRSNAAKARTVCLGTMGGIKINERMEVLDKKHAPIPGLYAGGYDAGGMFGQSYPIRDSSGLSSAFALNSGRIAGRNALKYVGRRP